MDSILRRAAKYFWKHFTTSQMGGNSGRKRVLALIENTAPVSKAIDLVRKASEGAMLTAVVRHGTFTEEELEAKTDSFYCYHFQMSLRSVFNLLETLRVRQFDSLIYAGTDKPQNRFLRLYAAFSGAKEKFFLDFNAEGTLGKLRIRPLAVMAGIAKSILIWVLLLPLMFMLRLFLKGSAAGKPGQKCPVKSESFSVEEIRKVSIVIPNYNGRELLSECLPGIMKAVEYCPGSEIILVDDASTDDSVRVLREEFPSIKVITHEKNLGFGRTCETGVRAAMNRLVVLLNSDVSAENDFITPLAAHFSDPDVFAVQPKMFYWEKNRFNLGMNMGRMEDGYIRLWNEAEAKNAVHVDIAAPNLYAIGGAMAFDKEKWNLLSGFDPLFYPFTWEDIDISYRALKRGWKVIYEPRSIVFHKHHGTLANVYSQSYRRIIEQKNEMLFIWKNIHDPEMILEHFRKLPKLLLVKQLSGDSAFAQAFFKAFKQIKEVVATRKNELDLSCFTDREVLEPPLLYYRRFVRNSFQDVGSGRRQILVMMPFMPYPPSDGGKIRVFMFLKHLSRQFDIHLLTFIEREEEKKHVTELKKIFKEVDVVLRVPTPLPWLRKILFPVYFRGIYSEAMRDKLIEILKKRPIDLVHIEFTQMSYYVEFIRHVPTLLTEHDAGILSIKKSYNRPNKGLRRIEDYIFLFQAHRWMKKYAKKFDKIIAVTDIDKKNLVSFRAEDDIEVVNTGVDIEYFSSGYEEVKENSLVFVGFMGHYPNVDAMLNFCNEIFPLIKAEVPDVKLTIIGSGNSNEINALKANSDIEVTGYVEDIRPYVRKGAVFLAPMRKGAGLKGKLLEAMAMCKPIVTTPIGCQGLPTVPGRDLLVAMKPEEFSQDVIKLLRDPTLRKMLALNAHEIVRRDFDWNRVSAKMAGIYRNVINVGGIIGKPQEALPK